MKIKSYISIFFFVFLIGLSNCKEDDNEMTGIALDKETVTLSIGTTTTVIPYPIPWEAKVNDTFTWSSENTTIATVDDSGVITGVAVGKTEVICHYDNFTATVQVTVETSD